MSSETITPRRIEILRGNVAKKIAAGEVIDRPFSVLRELIDNAVDAGADAIEIRIESGGISLIQVKDNGSGMNEEDVKLCWQSHATSKIRHEDDLLTVNTLGFRGEALSSIAAVSRLEITSREAGSDRALRLSMEGGSPPRYDSVPADRGTRVSVRDLFFNLPARRKFIKSPAAETRLCRNTVLEKAVAHPHIDFRFITDGKPRDLLPALSAGDDSQAYLKRVAETHPAQCRQELMHQIEGRGEGFSFSLVLGLPPLYRSDRKFIQVFCNRRRISEFSLIHAVEYGMGEILPGGAFPIAFLFLEIDPSDIDFNIHPAKREVRFAKPDSLHRAVRESVQRFLRQYHDDGPRPLSETAELFSADREGDARGVSSSTPENQPIYHRSGRAFDYQSQFDRGKSSAPAENSAADISATGMPATDSVEKAAAPFSKFTERAATVGEQTPVAAPRPAQDISAQNTTAPMPPYRYMGQLFSLFLAVEMGDSLYLIDMHAAHERILYDRFRAAKTSENLLIPLIIENDDPLLTGRSEKIAGELSRIGFKADADEQGHLHISAIPGALRGREKLLPGLIAGLGFEVTDLENKLYESMACRTAVKDGDVLDSDTARYIIEESWKLPVKRCPHGRPIWFSLSRDELFQLVGRVV